MKRYSTQSGFTLIEMIVSLAVFAGVITISVGALLVLVATNEQLQGEQSVMTNLSFALDSMTREIRTGTDYYCDERVNYTTSGSNNVFTDGNDLDGILFDSGSDEERVQDCDNGKANPNSTLQGLAFVEGGDSISGTDKRILYFFDSSVGQLFRRVGSGNAVPIVSSGIYIHNAEFFVTGSTPQSVGSGSFRDQASVTIFIEASEDASAAADDRYQIQTSVSQRTLDI